MNIPQKTVLLAKIAALTSVLIFPFSNTVPALAIIQVNNLGEQNFSSLNLSMFQLGSSFTTDNSNYILNSITFNLQEETEGSIFFDIYTDDSGLPGISIEKLTTTANILSGSFNNYLFTSANNINLNANTTYWLIGSTFSGSYNLAFTESYNQTGNWTIGNEFVAAELGSNGWINSPSDVVQFAVDADVDSAAVPFEFSPTTGILLMGALFSCKAAYGKYQESKIKN